MKSLSSKQRITVAAVVVLLLLFLLRPGASRLKSRIISSMSAGVGRSVDLGSAHFRLLPRPGFELENLVVYDDPLFGAEPMLRASEVTADLRITSLLRGRIEISRLELTEPSLNLVHREGGRWNLEALVERATQASTAATGSGRSGAHPRFPYIEGNSGRINFKTGAEKRPYALINADFSFWQDSENVWAGRLKAQPFRSDLSLNDVGQLQVIGSWQRAQTLRETPLQASVEWTRAQVGQVTKFLTGNDKGWRGEIQFESSLSGSLTNLKISSAISVDDFRRYDITSEKALRLAARCGGEYSSQSHEFTGVLCEAPVGSGLVTLTGNLGMPGYHHYAISLKAEDVPASGVATLAARAKMNVPEDLEASGVLRGSAKMEQDAEAGSPARFEGEGELKDLHLSSANAKGEFGPSTVPFWLVDDLPKSRALARQRNRSGSSFPKGSYIEFGPVALTTGHSGVANARGWLSRSAYNVSIAGDVDVARTLRLARMGGVPAIGGTADGTAQVNLQLAGSWRGEGGGTNGFPAPQVTGMAKLRNVRFSLGGSADPVEVSSADLQLATDGVSIRKLNAKAADTIWTGTLDLPRGCATPEACSIRFALSADEIALGRISEWISGRGKSRPWYRVLESSAKPGQSAWARLHASGQVAVKRLLVHGVKASNVSADVKTNSGKLEITALNADLLEGKLRGKWVADFSLSPSVCNGTGSVTGISLADVADQMGDDWVSGKAAGSYELKGPCTAEFWSSAEGTLHADMQDGALPHVFIEEIGEPLKINRLIGQAQLQSSKIDITSAKLDSPGGAYELSGTVSLKREVDLKLARVPASGNQAGYEITGTLAEPRVSPLSHSEQARLKPVSAK